MSVFTETNKDATVAYSDQIAQGPRFGFLGSFEAAYDAQVRASSQYGIEAFMREAEQENVRRIRAAGGEAPRSLNDSEDSEYIPRMMGGSGFTAGLNSRSYMDYARAAAANDDVGKAAIAGEREDRLKELQVKYPEAGIQTYSEIFEGVRQKAQEAEKLASSHSSTIPGYVGGFLGMAAGALDLRVNPLNFATLPVGAIGRTALARIGSQAGGQGAIEAINQVTGVQEERRILGVEHGVTNALTNIAGAAAGGAVLQGLGEAAGALGRRWFRDAPHDPAPPVPTRDAVETSPIGAPDSPIRTITVPPETDARIRAVVGDLLGAQADPIAKTRIGSARATADLDHTYSLLERWDTPAPWTIPPTTATRPFAQVDPQAGFKLPASAQELGVDARARLIDPEAFAMYDKMAADVAASRVRLADVETIREQARQAAAADTTQAQIDTLRGQMAGMKEGSKRWQKLADQVAELEANRPPAPAGVAPDAAQYEADIRATLMRADEGMRDLAPVISRAYARARDEWSASEALKAQVDDMIAKGSDVLPPAPKDIGPAPDELVRPITIEMKVPELNRSDIVRGPNDTPADIVAKAQQADAKVAEMLLDNQRAEIARVLNEPDGVIRLDGIDAEVRASDTINIEGPDGNMRTVSIKQAFEELNEDYNVLGAITSCRLNKTS